MPRLENAVNFDETESHEKRTAVKSSPIYRNDTKRNTSRPGNLYLFDSNRTRFGSPLHLLGLAKLQHQDTCLYNVVQAIIRLPRVQQWIQNNNETLHIASSEIRARGCHHVPSLMSVIYSAWPLL